MQYPVVPNELAVEAKKTVLNDDRFSTFRAAETPNGYRTATSFLVERRDVNLKGVLSADRITVKISFSLPADEDEFPLFLDCPPPTKNAPITGAVWVLSNDAKSIEATAALHGTFSCFGRFS